MRERTIDCEQRCEIPDGAEMTEVDPDTFDNAVTRCPNGCGKAFRYRLMAPGEWEQFVADEDKREKDEQAKRIHVALYNAAEVCIGLHDETDPDRLVESLTAALRAMPVEDRMIVAGMTEIEAGGWECEIDWADGFCPVEWPYPTMYAERPKVDPDASVT